MTPIIKDTNHPSKCPLKCRDLVPKAKQLHTTSYLALATAPIAPPHQALVIFILLGQVVIEDTLSYRLRGREKDSEGCMG